MSGVAIAEDAPVLCAQRVLFAGRSILLKTNAPKIARYLSGFFSEVEDAAVSSAGKLAEITLLVRDVDDAPSADEPWFRARGYFAVAQFTRADTLWFNLRTAEVFGSFSSSFADDRERWRKLIFPVLLGILCPAIDVVPVHAACLVRDSGGILLTGHSGTGKSTLTVSLAKRGYALLSDDWTYLSDSDPLEDQSSVDAWGIPIPVKLLPDASRFFPELLAYSTGVSLNGETAYEVSPEDCFGVIRRLHCRPVCIVLLERSQEPGCRISVGNVEEAIEMLAAQVEVLEGELSGCYKRQIGLIHRLANVVCLRVAFNDHPDRVAEALDRVLSVLN